MSKRKELLAVVAGAALAVFPATALAREVASKVRERQEDSKLRYRRTRPDDTLFG